MQRYLQPLVFLFFALTIGMGCTTVGGQSYEERIQAYRDSIDLLFADKRHSILPHEDLKGFQGLNYYPVDSAYRLPFQFERIEGDPFIMKTTTDREVVYRKYGEIRFELNSVNYHLSLYQNTELTDPEYADYLFCPFTDSTNGYETYGGGRYLDMRIADLEEGYVDFNLSYNPYCAYNYKYSCPIPPLENKLPIAIRAGVKSGIRSGSK